MGRGGEGAREKRDLERVKGMMEEFNRSSKGLDYGGTIRKAKEGTQEKGENNDRVEKLPAETVGPPLGSDFMGSGLVCMTVTEPPKDVVRKLALKVLRSFDDSCLAVSRPRVEYEEGVKREMMERERVEILKRPGSEEKSVKGRKKAAGGGSKRNQPKVAYNKKTILPQKLRVLLRQFVEENPTMQQRPLSKAFTVKCPPEIYSSFVQRTLDLYCSRVKKGKTGMYVWKEDVEIVLPEGTNEATVLEREEGDNGVEALKETREDRPEDPTVAALSQENVVPQEDEVFLSDSGISEPTPAPKVEQESFVAITEIGDDVDFEEGESLSQSSMEIDGGGEAMETTTMEPLTPNEPPPPEPASDETKPQPPPSIPNITVDVDMTDVNGTDEEPKWVPLKPPPIYTPTRAELLEFENACKSLTHESVGCILASVVASTSPEIFSCSFVSGMSEVAGSSGLPPTPKLPMMPKVTEEDMFPVLLEHVSETSLVHAVRDMLKHYGTSQHKVRLQSQWKGCGGRLTFLDKIAATLQRWTAIMAVHRRGEEEVREPLLITLGTLRMLTCVYSVEESVGIYEKDRLAVERQRKNLKKKGGGGGMKKEVKKGTSKDGGMSSAKKAQANNQKVTAKKPQGKAKDSNRKKATVEGEIKI